LKLQRREKKVPRDIGNFPKRISVCDLHTAFIFPYVCDYITKLYSKKQKLYIIIRMNMCCIGQGETRHRKYNRLKLDGGQANDFSSDEAVELKAE
jgi:hypothetical protein